MKNIKGSTFLTLSVAIFLCCLFLILYLSFFEVEPWGETLRILPGDAPIIFVEDFDTLPGVTQLGSLSVLDDIDVVSFLISHSSRHVKVLATDKQGHQYLGEEEILSRWDYVSNLCGIDEVNKGSDGQIWVWMNKISTLWISILVALLGLVVITLIKPR